MPFVPDQPKSYGRFVPDAQESQARDRPEISARNVYGAALEPIAHLGSAAIATPIAGLSGIATGGNADVVERVSGALTYQPRTEGGRAAVEGITYPFRKLGEFADVAGDVALKATGSPALATAVNVGVQSVPAALVGRGVIRPPSVGSRVSPGQGNPTPARPDAQRQAGLGRVSQVAPSIEELGAKAKAAYKRASDAGIHIAPGSFQNLKNRIGVTLNREGLDPTLHPQTSAAFKRIAETKGELSLNQLETLRKVANDAKGAQKADARLASIVVENIDDYIARLGRKDVTSGDPKAAAALKEARNLWSRKSKAEEIAQLIERAEISAPNFSASGFENALRTEFRSLAKNPKRMRRFTKEEQAAIKKVAQGGRLENAMRMIGKMAPTGAVSGMFGVLTSTAIPGGAALPIAGLAGRYAATRMTRRNAQRAEELMRRGPQNALIDSRRNALLERTR